MKKAMVLALCVVAMLLGIVSLAQADLTTIGTATYGGNDYNLIWQHDSSGTSLVWLDYSAPTAYWSDQMSWAAGLGSQLTLNIDPAYSVTWTDSAWRLPSAGSAPTYGFQAATQELGHLYYDELNLTGGSSGTGVTAPDLAASIFNNLELTGYWTSTPDDPLFNTGPVWMFAFQDTRSAPYYDTVYGFQDIDATSGSFFGIPLAVKHEGLAVRGADVTASAVPLPGAMLLLGAGLIRLAGYKRRKKIMG